MKETMWFFESRDKANRWGDKYKLANVILVKDESSRKENEKGGADKECAMKECRKERIK